MCTCLKPFSIKKDGPQGCIFGTATHAVLESPQHGDVHDHPKMGLLGQCWVVGFLYENDKNKIGGRVRPLALTFTV